MSIRYSIYKHLCAAAGASLLIGACSSAPHRAEGAASARAKLSQLQSDPELASRAPLAIEDADKAVKAAEASHQDREVDQHLVFIAEHKVDIAWARARSRLLEDQRKTLSEQREAARLEARTHEADEAHRDANVARNDAERARNEAAVAGQDADKARQLAEAALAQSKNATEQADTARSETANAEQRADAAKRDAEAANHQAEDARATAATAKMQSEDLQRQLAELNAKLTDRGMVVTLGDVLFSTGKSELRGGSDKHLGKLAAFLNKHQDRNVTIEGYTDSVGSESANESLSLRRADAVKSYLVEKGIAASRLSSLGKGEGAPVATNDSALGRQQNRRVEVVIADASH